MGKKEVRGWSCYAPVESMSEDLKKFNKARVSYCDPVRRKGCEAAGACAIVNPESEFEKEALLDLLGVKKAKAPLALRGKEWEEYQKARAREEKLILAHGARFLRKCKPVRIVVER